MIITVTKNYLSLVSSLAKVLDPSQKNNNGLLVVKADAKFKD